MESFVLVGTIVALVLSICAHEAAHAWAADKLGDPTARIMGRLTLNPLPHIDPFMTILLPTVLVMSGGPMFGGAKPVPVDRRNFRNPMRDNALVALAGPAMNLLLAILSAALLAALLHLGVFTGKSHGTEVLYRAIALNVLLMVFNLIPLPPLDGSRVVMYGLERAGAWRTLVSYAEMERIGITLLMFLLILDSQIQFGLRELIWGLTAPLVKLLTSAFTIDRFVIFQ